jgi:type I restriction enzyme S subunit
MPGVSARGDWVTETRPLRAYAEVALGRQRSPQHESGPHMVPYLRAANVKDGILDLSDVKEMNFTPSEQAIFSLRPGDVLVTEGSGSLSSVGASAVWKGELPGTVCFQNTLLRLRPRPSTDARYLAWWCRHAFADGLFASVSTGANIYHVSAERVRSLAMTYISIPRQRAIADFLDTGAARLDTILAKKLSLAAALIERHLTTIYRSVTGADAEGLRRNSGVPWIGDLRDHWGCPWLGANYETQLGKMLDSEAAVGPDQRPYVRNVNVQWDHVDLDDLATMHFSEADRRRCELREGDLLVCEGGEVGRAAVWPADVKGVYFQKAIHRVRPLKDGNTRFMLYCLRAAAHLNVFAVEGNQSTFVHLTGEKLREHRFPYPPLEEQAAIVRRLDEDGNKTRALTSAVGDQIALLQERRQALITAAVTGAMEIPGVAG